MHKLFLLVAVACLYANNASALSCDAPFQPVTSFPGSLEDVPTNFRPFVRNASYKIVDITACENDRLDGGVTSNATDAGLVASSEIDEETCEPVVVQGNFPSPANGDTVAHLEPNTQYELRVFPDNDSTDGTGTGNEDGREFFVRPFTTGAGPDTSPPKTPQSVAAYRATVPRSLFADTTTIDINFEPSVDDSRHWYIVEFSEHGTFEDPATHETTTPGLSARTDSCQSGDHLKEPNYVRIKIVDLAGNESDFSESAWIGPGCACSSSSQNGDGLLWLGVFAFGFVYLRRRS